MEYGYALSSEEHAPSALVQLAREAEETGFEFAFISDHFHPWINKQGQSPFVWSIIGGISQATKHIKIGTGVTCPTVRIHPAIIAQAAATSAALLPDRFMLGLGTGENLNEHIVGQWWPPIQIRREMLAEAIDIIKLLLEGGTKTYWGMYFDVDRARIYSLPKNPFPILTAASGEMMARVAGEIADGLISTGPDKKVVDAFNENGNNNRPKYGQIAVCYGKNTDMAIETAHAYWPNSALQGRLSADLATPQDFESAAQNVRKDDVATSIVCGPDIDSYIERVKEYQRAGFDHIYFHQIGPDQKSFLDFYKKALSLELKQL
jgi:coenzyme F420-dependent glucose-6-phosphate dehydrogenase